MKAYFLCSTDEDLEFAYSLYDRFSHNEISGDNLVDEILGYCRINRNYIDGYIDSYPDEFDESNIVYQNESFIVTYDMYIGIYDIYAK